MPVTNIKQPTRSVSCCFGSSALPAVRAEPALALESNDPQRTTVRTPELGETIRLGPAPKHLFYPVYNSTFDLVGQTTPQNRLQSIPVLSYDCP
jgi:hypothetical protein